MAANFVNLLIFIKHIRRRKMATIIWKGFEKEPTESLNESYELITGQNLKPSTKEQSKKQPGKPIQVIFHQVQEESITPDEIDENNESER